MKKLILSIILFLTFSGIVYAAGVNGQYKGYDIINVTYKGAKLATSDVPAVFLDGRTMIPLDMLRKIGFDVGWDQATYTADITPAKPPQTEKRILSMDEITALKDRVALVYGLDDFGIRKWQGSGFMLNSNGLMITANHVLTDEKGNDLQLEVIINGKTYRIPKSSAAFRDKEKDIAGIYLHDSEPFPYLKIGELPKFHDIVYAISNPEGKLQVVTSGLVNGVDDGIIGTDEIAKPGSSGGALINQYGEIVGVLEGDFYGSTLSVPIRVVQELYMQSINE